MIRFNRGNTKGAATISDESPPCMSLPAGGNNVVDIDDGGDSNGYSCGDGNRDKHKRLPPVTPQSILKKQKPKKHRTSDQEAENYASAERLNDNNDCQNNRDDSLHRSRNNEMVQDGETNYEDNCMEHYSVPRDTTVGNEGNSDDSDEMGDDWNKLVERGTGSAQGAPNLDLYLAAKSCRETAKEQFSNALDECMANLQDEVTDMLQELVVPVHEEQREKFDAYEDDIVATMTSNHDRRKKFHDSLELANTEWTRRYQRLMEQLLLLSNSDGDTVTRQDSAESKQEPSKEQPDKGSKDDDRGGDPDWDELAQYKPSRENIRCFLDVREQLQTAAEQLSQSLDDIHAGLKGEVEGIVKIAADLHNHHEEHCLQLEDDIQFHILTNRKRRTDLADRLEESAKQSQGLIARLLAQLTRTNAP